MSEAREILSTRLAQLIKMRGISPRKASLDIGANHSYVGQLISGKGGIPSAERLRALADVLETTTTYLLGETDAVDQPAGEVAIFDPGTWRDRHAERVPIYGTGYCDDLEIESDGHVWQVEQTMFEPTHVVQMIDRPAALRGAHDAYGIYFHGSSMEPRFFQGEIAIVIPNPPPGPGDFVVVQLNNGAEDHVVHVLVKRLIRTTSSYVELEQYNPAMVFRIDRKRIARMHRILSPTALLAK